MRIRATIPKEKYSGVHTHPSEVSDDKQPKRAQKQGPASTAYEKAGLIKVNVFYLSIHKKQ
jgi:hypothetical protein